MKMISLVGKLTQMLFGVVFGFIGSNAAYADSHWQRETITHLATDPHRASITVADHNGINFTYTFTTSTAIDSAYVNTDFSTGTHLASVLDASGLFGLSQGRTVQEVHKVIDTKTTNLLVSDDTAKHNLIGVHSDLAEFLFACDSHDQSQFQINGDHGDLSEYHSYEADDMPVIQSSIPEPQTYVMLVVGVLAVGLMVRRRKYSGVEYNSFAI